MLGGITIDWRHNFDWNEDKKIYEEFVNESISITLKNPQQKGEGNISKEILDYYTVTKYHGINQLLYRIPVRYTIWIKSTGFLFCNIPPIKSLTFNHVASSCDRIWI